MPRVVLSQASVHDLAQIAEVVNAAAESCGFDVRAAYQIQMAVDEACSNVLLHAYQSEPGRLEIEIECQERFLEVLISDWGATFDFEEIPDPDIDAPLDQRPIGGLGLFFIRKFMDEVEFESDPESGNRLRLRRYR